MYSTALSSSLQILSSASSSLILKISIKIFIYYNFNSVICLVFLIFISVEILTLLYIIPLALVNIFMTIILNSLSGKSLFSFY